MKKILGLFLVSLSLLVSCDKELLEPFTPGQLTEEVAITKSSDLTRLLNSAMNIMTNRTEYVFSSVFTDEAAPGFNNGGQGITSDYIFLMNQSNASANSIWTTYYFALARINRVITFADSVVPIDAADQQIINRAKAEALVLRALCHSKILSYFSTDPKSDAALAGVLANRIISTSETPSRATNGQFYASMHADLDAAIAIFNSNTAPAYANRTYYASRVLAQALKARIFALKGDYTNAGIWANTVINTSGITLANTQTAYNAVFHTHNEAANTEVIFRLRRTVQQNSQATNLHNGWASVANRRNGSPFYEVSRALYNQVAAIPTDIRLNTMVFLTGTATTSSLIDPNYATATDVRNTDIIVLQKHGGQTAATATNGANPDFMVCRLSEMYFIKAESEVAAGNLTAARTTLQTLVNARFTTPPTVSTFATAQAAWKAILDERRIELAFEGFRFIDLKRLGTLANAGLDRHPSEYASASWNFPAGNPSNLPLTSYKWALPIPQDEINGNGGIQQNPGY
jgi:hypothetical protein